MVCLWLEGDEAGSDGIAEEGLRKQPETVGGGEGGREEGHASSRHHARGIDVVEVFCDHIQEKQQRGRGNTGGGRNVSSTIQGGASEASTPTVCFLIIERRGREEGAGSQGAEDDQ